MAWAPDGASRLHPGRSSLLRDGGGLGDRIVYWMQSSMRTAYNPALEVAISISNESRKPLDVLIVIDDLSPDANIRSSRFFLEGVDDVSTGLHEQGINLSVRVGRTDEQVIEHMEDAVCLVLDKGYLAHHRGWYRSIHESSDITMMQVEGDVTVPVRSASDHDEWSAATFRRRMTPLAGMFPIVREGVRPKIRSLGLWDEGLHWRGVEEYLRGKRGAVDPSFRFRGGERAALNKFNKFLKDRLSSYAAHRNDPVSGRTSDMSPYLHFGHVSPNQLLDLIGPVEDENPSAYREQLVIRRELAVNLVEYNQMYDRYAGLPEWCRKTLEEHADDPREYVYTFDELEKGRTDDQYWNAAQREMVVTGKMHNYMRMYWGKKILEWSDVPEKAFETALRLNNRYELDGRDPNGYAGVAWCFGKHDRPWKERPIFGKIRYMNDKGLERKFDMRSYVRMTQEMKAHAEDVVNL